MANPWYKNTIIYGIDVSRFYDSNGDGIGDLPGVIAKLDYLKDLGVDCIWLLPFFPSPRRDNGYDITDYKDVDSRFGTLDDLRDLVGQAHSRGIKIIIDLVMHHTSIEHPWFKAAVTDPSSQFHSYYIWAKKPTFTSSDENMLPDAEDGVWQYVRQLGQYYHHRFYHFQADLDISNKKVMQEIKEVVDFWLAFDVDGFRIDAATHMFEQKGAARASVPGGQYLEELRRHAEKQKRDVVLLGEANEDLHKIQTYMAGGNRLNMLFNFLFTNQLYLAFARETTKPLVKHFENTKTSHKNITWVNFARNLDEIDLSRLTESERQEIYKRFAPQSNMQIFGRGIRRNLPSMFTSDDQLRMLYSLVFSAPGTPLIVYGSEIGMGDDLTRLGRFSIRLPMQWDDADFAGFSTKEPDDIVGPVLADGHFSYPRINVADQQQKPDSLWNFMKNLMNVRSRYPLDTSNYSLPNTGNEAVLAMEYNNVLIVHNVSKKKQKINLDLSNMTIVFGEDCLRGEISPYGFSWLYKRTDNL